MKKFLSISLLLSVLFLYGCSSSNKLSADQLFEKKQECAKLENDMRAQLESPERYWWRLEDTTIYLSEIFYSPSRNSCLYKSEFIMGDNYDLAINDYFTKEVVYQTFCDIKNGYNTCSDEFRQRLEELK